MNGLCKSPEFDSYEIDEQSDEERSESSSDDELDVLLNGTPDQKKKLIREYLTGESESSSADEFDKEMEAELTSTVKARQGSWGPGAVTEFACGAGSEDLKGDSNIPKPQIYDDIYFDSDSEGEDTPSSSTGKRQLQRVIPTNDELLYDPDGDDNDQAWVDARRYSNQREPTVALQSQLCKPRGLPKSDAVLNCPACMTTLCLDCQRHEKYQTQYRAMFVMNCKVKRDEVLRYKHQLEKKQRTRRGGQKSGVQGRMDTEDAYHPVHCSECSTEVAMFDKDEVYHFFNILASHC
ncbi:E2F-associated phosphoprotein [Odontesthes bonariensis]|uniref:E2F-associated phosphoprotein n=1 Tax=Odontesthes bonariensis TaxID=219752 RepID=UPI003F58B3D2